jgi:hypothetical protein
LGVAVNTIARMTGSASTPTSASTTAGPDQGVRLQVTPDTTHRIPVVYGSAYLGGIVTDAQPSADSRTMSVVFAICEQTGTLLSTGQASQIQFQDVYMNNSRLIFDTDGQTVLYSIDAAGKTDTTIGGYIRVRCFSGSSNNPVVPVPYTNTALSAAYAVVPNWTANYTMDQLVFAVVELTYNAKANITNLPTFTWHITNSMTQPGDCLFDYMTNSRYGANIDPSTIYAS